MTTDLHTHYFAEQMLTEINDMLVERIGEDAAITSFYESDEVGPSTEGADERVEMMDQWGLERAVVSFPSPDSFIDEEHLSRPEIYREFSRIVNDHISAAHERYPGRLFGFASVPLVSPAGAIEELDRAIDDLGLQGVVLDTNVFGRYLDHEGFRPFFEHVNDRGVPIFLHPTNPAGRDRLDRFYGTSMIGFPLDTTIAASYLIFSGFMELFDDLEIILSHLGGALPFLQRRVSFEYDPHDPAFTEGVVTQLEKEPVEYLQEFWYDTAMTFPRAMEMTLELVGERLVFGSDYPFGPADSVTTTGDQINELDVDDAAARRILDDHAEHLLLNT